jgi:hypothetical protein
MDGAEKVADRGLALPDTAARSRTAARLAAAGGSTAGRLAAAVASTTGGLAAAVTGTASRLAAASTAIGLIAAAVAAATMLRTALLEQALQPAEEVVLLAAAGATARSIAAAVSRPTGRLAAAVASTARGLAAAIAGIAARLTTSSTGIAAGLTTRISTAMVAEHPIQELETIGLATNGDTENQRTEEHHTLHRATSPLLADHLRIVRPVREACHPEVVIHELFHGRPVEPIRDSIDRRLLPPPGCPTGTVMPRGTCGLSANW